MPDHWTYSSYHRDDELYQGDILSRTPKLDSILLEQYRFHISDKCTFLIVATQSCDLVIRHGGSCKADFINLAVVYEFDALLPDLVSRYAGTGLPGIFDLTRRRRAEEFLERVINQNEQAHGLFYLHPDASIGIATPSVALLRVSLPIGHVHYKTIQNARCGRLAVDFQARIGWLCGNLYSRVAARDWKEPGGATEETNLIDKIMKSVDGISKSNWVPPSWILEVQKKKVDLKSKEIDEAIRLLKEHAPPEPIQVACKRIKIAAQHLLAKADADEAREMLAADARLWETVWNQLAFTIGGEHQQNLELERSLGRSTQLKEQVLQLLWTKVKDFVFAKTGSQPSDFTLILQELNCKPLTNSIRGVLLELNFEAPPHVSAIQKLRLLDVPTIDRVAQAIDSVVNRNRSDLADNLIARLINDTEFKNSFRASELVLPDE